MGQFKTVFLDRDGVINHDSPGYIKSVAELVFIPGSLEAIGELSQRGLDVFIVTNQSGVGRGLFSAATLAEIHQRLVASACRKGGRITDIFYCPHTPEDACDCRKPKPGMIRQAQLQYQLDLTAACLVGDSLKDLECAQAAGLAAWILVQTGNGQTAFRESQQKGLRLDFLAEDLQAAAQWILNRKMG